MINTARSVIFAALFAGLAAGCAKSSPTATLALASVSLHANESVNVDNGAARVSLYRVDSDSRCAVDVQCVSAGNAVVVFSIIDTSCRACLPVQQFVNTTIEPRSIVAGNHRVALDSLLPAPRSGRVIAQSEYVAYFTVTRP